MRGPYRWTKSGESALALPGVAGAIRAARLERKMTQAQFADMLGMSRASLSHLEAGIRMAGYYQRQRIIKALPEAKGWRW